MRLYAILPELSNFGSLPGRAGGLPNLVKKLLHDVVARLFKDAGVKYQRTSARGQDYSIADSIYEEYVRWFDMPWE